MENGVDGGAAATLARTAECELSKAAATLGRLARLAAGDAASDTLKGRKDRLRIMVEEVRDVQLRVTRIAEDLSDDA
jgi:hypothetical protein